jgi:hypothetical protein
MRESAIEVAWSRHACACAEPCLLALVEHVRQLWGSRYDIRRLVVHGMTAEDFAQDLHLPRLSTPQLWSMLTHRPQHIESPRPYSDINRPPALGEFQPQSDPLNAIEDRGLPLLESS